VRAALWRAALFWELNLLGKRRGRALVTVSKQTAEIKELKDAIRALQVENGLRAARPEGIAIAAAATRELSRWLGYLEGRASRDEVCVAQPIGPWRVPLYVS
jgi:hypothetical protein